MKIFRNTALDLLELGVGDNTLDWGNEDGLVDCLVKFELVQEELIDTTRWSHVYERIYKDLTTGKFYSTTYQTGATECQDERPYEYDGAEVEFTEVKPVERTIVVYEAV